MSSISVWTPFLFHLSLSLFFYNSSSYSSFSHIIIFPSTHYSSFHSYTSLSFYIYPLLLRTIIFYFSFIQSLPIFIHSITPFIQVLPTYSTFYHSPLKTKKFQQCLRETNTYTDKHDQQGRHQILPMSFSATTTMGNKG